MKELELNEGKKAVVDDSEYGHLIKFHWYVDQNGYVVRRDRGKKSERTFYMHRQIMGDPKYLVVDHVDRNPLNNSISNLRLCFQKNNSTNRIGWAKKSTSPYKGVFYRGNRKQKNPWVASITYERKQHHLGQFPDSRSAAKAYNKAARKYHGEFALLNKIEEN